MSTTASNLGIEEVVSAILAGSLDGEEDRIVRALKQRRRIADENKVDALKVGDTVRFNSHARPKYLHGLTGTVIKLNQASAVVRINGDAGRFTGVDPRCPIAIIDKVEGGD
jgi:uncharacterized protein YkvS